MEIHMSIDIRQFSLIYTTLLLIYMCFLLIYMRLAKEYQLSSQFGWVEAENGPNHCMTTQRPKMTKNKKIGIGPNQSRITLGRSLASKNIKMDPKPYSRTSKMEGYFELKCRMSADGKYALH